MAEVDGLELLRRIKRQWPDLPVLLMTAYATVQQAVDAMRDGAADYLIKPFEAEVLVGKVASYVRTRPRDGVELVSEDPKARSLVALARRVAKTDVTVLLTGESGTGKEVIARHIHEHSERASGPFVAINCAAIPDNMLEAVLFGYEKGAYTGAHKACPGKFEQAQKGTILLDEITEMDPGLQAKLLRVLQEREIERLGAREVIDLDVRVVAASNRDVKMLVNEGVFREDLYYRLNVFPLHLPALRERPGDIVPLAEHLLRKAALAAGRTAPRLTPGAAERLRGYPWPGNVRELDNVMQRALVLASDEEIDVDALHLEPAPAAGAVSAASPPDASLEADATLGDGLREREHRLILEALEAGAGSRKLAAERLGISPRTLRYKLARMREAGVVIPR